MGTSLRRYNQNDCSWLLWNLSVRGQWDCCSLQHRITKSMHIYAFYYDFSARPRYGAMLQVLYFRNGCIGLHVGYTVGKLIKRSIIAVYNLRQVYFAHTKHSASAFHWDSCVSCYLFCSSEVFQYLLCQLFAEDLWNSCLWSCDKEGKTGSPTNVHRTFSPRSINAVVELRLNLRERS